MRVAIIGAGYVGLVTGACLAEQGHDVVCVDVDKRKIRQIASGFAPIHEPGLEELLKKHAGGRLRATASLAEAVLGSELTLIAVGTPFDGSQIDLTAVLGAAREVGEALAEKLDYHVVVVKSTVPPGTTDDIVLPLLEQASGNRAGADFGVGVNPEFLSEGEAVADFLFPDRIVLGGIDERTLDVLDALYAAVSGVPRLRTNTRTAEMIKYASNALLATMISFANEIANLCAAVGDTDVVEVMRGVHLSRYLTHTGPDGSPVVAPITSFLEAGCGFGGSCLPKDVRALIAHGERLGQPMRVLKAVIDTNDAQPDEVVRLLTEHLPDLRGAKVTILGLAFKPGTDDVRESPAIPVVQRLLRRGASVTVHDPVVTRLPASLEHAGVTFCPDLREALLHADAVVLVTRWEHSREVPGLLADLDHQAVVIDGCRMLDKASVLRYAGIGL